MNYADDLVILCKSKPEEALAAMRRMMERLKLTVNDAAKTHICRVPEEHFDFPGYRFAPVATSNSSTRGRVKLLHPMQRDWGTLFGRIALGNLNW